MASWRDDKRFKCPDCGGPIALKFMATRLPGSADDIVAVCFACEYVYTIEEWASARAGTRKKRHPRPQPYWPPKPVDNPSAYDDDIPF